MQILERYRPVILGINSTTPVTGSNISGFMCITAGNVTIYDAAGVLILNGFPVTAGGIYGMPIITSAGNKLDGGSIVLSGGASGTLLL